MGTARTVALRVVAVASVVVAALGALYTWHYLRLFHPVASDEFGLYFKQAYYVMVGICLLFYVGLAFFGLQFWRLRTAGRYWFLGLVLAEVVYFGVVGLFWRLENQDIARSVAAATGVANGGLLFQAVTLYPVWSAAVVFWAHAGTLKDSSEQ